MKKLLILSLIALFIVSCSDKENVVYLNSENMYKPTTEDKYITVPKETKKKIKNIVKNEAELPETKTEKIIKVVKKEKAKTKKKVEEKYQKILTPYKEEKIKKELLLLKSPVTPIREPDKIIRILLLPFVDEQGAFHSGEYLFEKVEEGKWIIGTYLKVDKRKVVKEYNPLVEVKQ